jgi:hypothetical protein
VQQDIERIHYINRPVTVHVTEDMSSLRGYIAQTTRWLTALQRAEGEQILRVC